MTRTACLFPGQGSQRQGMGAALFERFTDEVAQASEILGWSLPEVCRDDPGGMLRRTEIAQPALFMVDALGYLRHVEEHGRPDYVAGHSLGEYAALFAAGCLDLATGVRLTRRRGELMGRAPEGAMVAVVGADRDELARVLAAAEVDIDVANYNSADQTVLSGPKAVADAAAAVLADHELGRVIYLPVSGAFHSRLMTGAARAFGAELAEVGFAAPRIPVISNVTARPYRQAEMARVLAAQVDSPVCWTQTMAYLVDHGVREVVELGPGTVLTSLWRSAHRRAMVAAPTPVTVAAEPAVPVARPTAPGETAACAPTAESLGSAGFRRDYGVRCAYVTGSMYHGIASTELVVAMGRAGLLGFFGAGGLPLDDVDEAIGRMQDALGKHGRYGVNLLCTLDNPELEDALVTLYLRRGVRFVEAAAYPHITSALVRWRCTGAHLDGESRPVAPNRVLAKVSRPEVARAFMSPPPERILHALVGAGRLSRAEAAAAGRLPMAEEVCVESDSAGHTDQGVALVLLPAMRRLRDQLVDRHRYECPIRIGAAGGLGSPEALAAVFVLGADFVVTGSINQCTPQAGTSDEVKEILASLDVQDTAYAPAGDLFELGAQVQVARKGTLFPVRAARLYQTYRGHRGWGEVDPAVRTAIERDCFGRSFAEVWADTRGYLRRRHPAELARADADARRQMAWTFRWYFRHATEVALRGDRDARVDYQIHCGPAMGTFNRWVAGTDLADWRRRDVQVVAKRLMDAAAMLLGERLAALTAGAAQ